MNPDSIVQGAGSVWPGKIARRSDRLGLSVYNEYMLSPCPVPRKLTTWLIDSCVRANVDAHSNWLT